MAPLKRKRPSKASAPPVDSDSGSSDGDDNDDYEVVSPDVIDISNALTGATIGGNGDDDDDIDELIRSQQDKRNLKDGTEALKRVVKGQSKQGAGVTGGGSFQSMGMSKHMT